MCCTRHKFEGGVVALRESDDTNFLKPNGQSRNLNVYAHYSSITLSMKVKPLYLACDFGQIRAKPHPGLSYASSFHIALHYSRINVASSCLYNFNKIKFTSTGKWHRKTGSTQSLELSSLEYFSDNSSYQTYQSGS